MSYSALMLLAQGTAGTNSERLKACWLVPLTVTETTASVGEPISVDCVETLAELLIGKELSPGRGVVTVWTPAGWREWSMCGITKLIDQRRITYRALTLDGERSSLTGQLDGRPLVLCSLAAWTGGNWRQWHEKCLQSQAHPVQIHPGCSALPDNLVGQARTTAAIVRAVVTLQAGPVRSTPASQGRQLWRAWLGPQIPRYCDPPSASAPSGGCKWETIPIKGCPPTATWSARQGSYGLAVRQFQRGRVNGPVYVWDIQGAYLTALCRAQVPVVYDGEVHKPTIKRLRALAANRVVCGLVHIDSESAAYPVRRSGKVDLAVGRFWSWLTGEELWHALSHNHVNACHVAHHWHGHLRPQNEAAALCSVADLLKQSEGPLTVAVWRTLYASLVGSWAAWKREWEECHLAPPLGRWASWLEQDRNFGIDYRYRAVAGRVQRLSLVEGADCARPIAYAAVTAAVRAAIERCRSCLPLGSVLAVCADSLWLSERGHAAMEEIQRGQGQRSWRWKLKETYDDAWMDGDSRAVVRIGDRLAPVVPGVPHEAVVGSDGKGRWKVLEPWHVGARRKGANDVAYTTLTYNVARHQKENSRPLRESQPWIEMRDEDVPTELVDYGYNISEGRERQ